MGGKKEGLLARHLQGEVGGGIQQTVASMEVLGSQFQGMNTKNLFRKYVHQETFEQLLRSGGYKTAEIETFVEKSLRGEATGIYGPTLRYPYQRGENVLIHELMVDPTGKAHKGYGYIHRGMGAMGFLDFDQDTQAAVFSRHYNKHLSKLHGYRSRLAEPYMQMLERQGLANYKGLTTAGIAGTMLGAGEPLGNIEEATIRAMEGRPGGAAGGGYAIRAPSAFATERSGIARMLADPVSGPEVHRLVAESRPGLAARIESQFMQRPETQRLAGLFQ